MLPGRDRIVSRAFPRGPALGWRVDLHSALLGRQRLYGAHSAVGRRASQRTCPRDRRGLLHVSPPPRWCTRNTTLESPTRRRPSVASRGGLERRRKPISAAIMPYSLHSQNGAEDARWGRDDLLWIRPSWPLRGASATVLAVKRFLGAMAVCLAGWR